MEHLRRVWQVVGMEPALFLYMSSSLIRLPVFQSMLYEKVCLNEYGNNESVVNCTDIKTLHKDLRLHEYFNQVYLVSSLCLMIPSMFTTILLGSMFDAWRFKVPMLIPFAGLIVSNLNYILQAAFMFWNPYWLVLSDVIFGLCGGYISITSTIFSYSMRMTEFEYRSERVAVLEGSIGIGSAIGSLLSGFIRKKFGYVAVFILITVLNALACIYIAVMAQEIQTAESTDAHVEEGSKTLLGLAQKLGRHFKDIRQIVLVERDPLVRQLIILTLVSLAIELFSFSGVTDILFSFMFKRFAWTDIHYGVFNSIQSILGCFNILIVYPVCHRVFAVANVSLAIFARTSWLAYMSLLPMSFNRFVATSLRVIVGQLVFDKEQGRAFSFIALIESVSVILATSVFNGFYPKSLRFFDGIMLILTAILITIPLIILIHIRPKVKQVLRENEQQHRTDSTSDEQVDVESIHS